MSALRTEQWLKSLLPFVQNIFIYGDNRPYLIALITIKSIRNMSVGDCYMIPDDIKYYFRSLGAIAVTSREVMKNYIIGRVVFETIQEYNKEYCSSSDFYIRRYAILPRPFTLDRDEISYAGELKRRMIIENYSELIESMYLSYFDPITI